MSIASTVMTKNVISVSESTTIQEYLKLIQERAFSGCPVVDSEGFALGFVSQSDVLRGLTAMLSSGNHILEGKQKRQLSIALLLTGKRVTDASLFERFLSMSVTEIMSKGIYSCHLNTPLAEVCETMSRLHVHRLIVVDAYGKLSGLISSLDALQQCAKEIKREDDPRERPVLRNLPPVNEDPAEKEISD